VTPQTETTSDGKRRKRHKLRGQQAVSVPGTHGQHSSPSAAPSAPPTTLAPTPTGSDKPDEPGQPGSGTPTPVVGATKEQLTELCDSQVTKAYAKATEQAHTTAVEACVGDLTGKTLADAKLAVADLVAKLDGTVDGLHGEPATEPTGSTGSTDGPGGEPTSSQSPSATASGSPSATQSATSAG
jgi:hypothetical protein